RMAAILSLVRRLDGGARLDRRLKSIEVADEDFAVAMQLAHIYLAHGVELARRLPKPRMGLRDAKRSGHRRFFDLLTRQFGAGLFTRDAAKALAVANGISVRTADRYLAEFVKRDLLTRPKEGHYHRT